VLWMIGRQSGNYQLINIKAPADCFVPRLVTENALVFADSQWVTFHLGE